jgi:hypothetical protein
MDRRRRRTRNRPATAGIVSRLFLARSMAEPPRHDRPRRRLQCLPPLQTLQPSQAPARPTPTVVSILWPEERSAAPPELVHGRFIKDYVINRL